MINDNIYKSIHSMASATGPTATGISQDANPADDVNNTDPNLKRISQFILLGAAEATGNRHHNLHDGKSELSYESSLDIMSVQNNEELKDEFDEFIEIPTLVSDNESEEIESIATKTSAPHWKPQLSLQPTSATSQSSSNREGVQAARFNVQSANNHQHQPVVHQHTSTQRANIKRGILATRKNNQQPTITVDDVKQSINSTTTTTTTTTASTSKQSSLECSQEQFKLERTKIMTIVIKYVTAKIHNSFPPDSGRNVKQNELPLDKFLLILTSRLRITLPVFLKAIIYLFRYMDIIYLLRYLNQTNNFVNYNDMGFELKKLIVGCLKLAIIKENRINKKKYVLNWEQITGLKNQEINSIVKTLVGRMNGKLNIKDVEVANMKNEMFRFVKMISTQV